MRAQVLQRERPAEVVQRMVGRREADEAHLHQRVARESCRDDGADREVGLALDERFLGAAEHRFDQLDARLGPLRGELREALEQQPGREHDLRREPQFGLPALREFAGGVLEPRRLLEQGFASPVQHLAGGGEHGLAAADLEHLHAQQALEFLHCVGEC